MPAATSLAHLFEDTPILPLQRHMVVVEESAANMVPLAAAICSRDREKVQALRDEIFSIGRLARNVEQEIESHIGRIPNSVFDRQNLITLSISQSALANSIGDLAGLLLAQEIEVPDPLGQPFQELVSRSVEAVIECTRAVGELEDLAGLGARDDAHQMIEELETQLDAIAKEVGKRSTEVQEFILSLSHLAPVSVFLWHEIVQEVAEISSKAVKVGESLRLLTTE